MRRVVHWIGIILCVAGCVLAIVSVVNFWPMDRMGVGELHDRAVQRVNESLRGSPQGDQVLPLTHSQMRRQNAWFALVGSLVSTAGGLFLIRRCRPI